MKKRVSRGWLVVLCTLALSLGLVTVFSSGPVQAGPEPDCGPDFTWDCTMPNGTHQLVEGTRCDIAAFQRQTGARCVIARGF